MNLRLFALKLYIPGFIEKRKLGELFRMTASAFACEAPEVKGRSYSEQLKTYAVFTRDAAEKSLEEGKDIEEIKARLFQGAYRLGQNIRRIFCLEGPDEIMEMTRILYQILGIDFLGETCGDVTIKSCIFSKYYSPRVCRLISSLDEGLAAGISGGGSLIFSQRITEDKDCCRARFVIPDQKT